MFFIKAVSVILMATSFAYGFFVIGPTAETKFYPVMSRVNIEKTVFEGPEITIIHTTFTKYRDCEYLGLAWYRGQRGSPMMRVIFDIVQAPGDTSIINRPVGPQISNPWRVGVPFAELKLNSFADAFHRCHPFWVSRSLVYN